MTAIVYVNRGVAKRKLRQHSAAIVNYKAAIRLDPNESTAYYNRGVAKGDLGQYSAAILDYDQSIHLNPDEALVYHRRGIAKAGFRIGDDACHS